MRLPALNRNQLVAVAAVFVMLLGVAGFLLFTGGDSTAQTSLAVNDRPADGTSATAPLRPDRQTGLVTVPDVVGQPVDMARTLIEDRGLAMLSYGNAEVATGQQPAAGAEVSPGTQVMVRFGDLDQDEAAVAAREAARLLGVGEGEMAADPFRNPYNDLPSGLSDPDPDAPPSFVPDPSDDPNTPNNCDDPNVQCGGNTGRETNPDRTAGPGFQPDPGPTVTGGTFHITWSSTMPRDPEWDAAYVFRLTRVGDGAEIGRWNVQSGTSCQTITLNLPGSEGNQQYVMSAVSPTGAPYGQVQFEAVTAVNGGVNGKMHWRSYGGSTMGPRLEPDRAQRGC